MATLKNFTDIDAWQRARALTNAIYVVSKNGSFSKDFGLRDQMRRASVSIMANIAEGFGRSGSAEFQQYLAIAKGRLVKSFHTSTLRWIRVISPGGSLQKTHASRRRRRIY